MSKILVNEKQKLVDVEAYIPTVDLPPDGPKQFNPFSTPSKTPSKFSIPKMPSVTLGTTSGSIPPVTLGTTSSLVTQVAQVSQVTTQDAISSPKENKENIKHEPPLSPIISTISSSNSSSRSDINGVSPPISPKIPLVHNSPVRLIDRNIERPKSPRDETPIIIHGKSLSRDNIPGMKGVENLPDITLPPVVLPNINVPVPTEKPKPVSIEEVKEKTKVAIESTKSPESQVIHIKRDRVKSPRSTLGKNKKKVNNNIILYASDDELIYPGSGDEKESDEKEGDKKEVSSPSSLHNNKDKEFIKEPPLQSQPSIQVQVQSQSQQSQQQSQQQINLEPITNNKPLLPEIALQSANVAKIDPGLGLIPVTSSFTPVELNLPKLKTYRVEPTINNPRRTIFKSPFASTTKDKDKGKIKENSPNDPLRSPLASNIKQSAILQNTVLRSNILHGGYAPVINANRIKDKTKEPQTHGQQPNPQSNSQPNPQPSSQPRSTGIDNEKMKEVKSWLSQLVLPNFDAMSEGQRATYFVDLRVSYGYIRHAFPQFNMPAFPDNGDLKKLYIEYMRWSRYATASNSTVCYRAFLILFWLAFEIFGTRVLGLKFSNFTANQISAMSQYNMVLQQLGEQDGESIDAHWHPVTRLGYMSLRNGTFFVLINYLAGWIGEDFANTIKNLINQMMTPTPPVQIPTTQSQTEGTNLGGQPRPPAPPEAGQDWSAMFAQFAPMIANLGANLGRGNQQQQQQQQPPKARRRPPYAQ